MTYLGIDLGTSEVKALLMDSAGRILGVTKAPLTVLRPHPHWSEQSPEAWWQATLHAVDQLQKNHAKAMTAVRGLGLSGQMHGATLLDSKDRPLRPAILWNDTRSDTQCADLTTRVPRIESITGNIAMPGLTAPKLLWVAEHEPENFEQITSILLPKDYLRLRLTGDKVTDMSDASGTLWLDVAARVWSDDLLAGTGLTRAQMPRLVEGNAPSGYLNKVLMERWDIRQPVIVAGGAGDNAASAVGIGATAPGDGFISLGTSGVIFVVADRFQPNPQSAVHTFCHALPDRWHQMSVMLSAASCLRWVVQLSGAQDEIALLEEISALDEKARRQAPIFLPYLSGERTPHNDPHAQGVFFGLTHNMQRAALGYAVIEGVAFGLADGLDALMAAGNHVNILSLVGGGTRSSEWSQIIANVIKKPVQTYVGGEIGAALGAARLAQMAFGEKENIVCGKPPIEKTFIPQSAAVAILSERLQRFRRIYTATKPLFTHAIV